MLTVPMSLRWMSLISVFLDHQDHSQFQDLQSSYNALWGCFKSMILCQVYLYFHEYWGNLLMVLHQFSGGEM